MKTLIGRIKQNTLKIIILMLASPSMAFGQGPNVYITETSTFDPTEAVQMNSGAFTDFSAVMVEDITYLNWYTNNDRENGIFIIERSTDAGPFEYIGYKQRFGQEVDMRLRYSLMDIEPSGNAIYRVIQYNQNASVVKIEQKVMTHFKRPNQAKEDMQESELRKSHQSKAI